MDINMQDIASLIGSLGFPIVVTGYLLVKGSQVVSSITGAINDTRVAIESMKAAIDHLGDRIETVEKERSNNG